MNSAEIHQADLEFERTVDSMPQEWYDVMLRALGDTPRERAIRASWVIATIEGDQIAAIKDAREAGTSWAEIGRWFSITRQSAHERWAGSLGYAVPLRAIVEAE